MDYKKEYTKVKKEFEDYRFSHSLTKEDKIKWLHKYFGFKDEGYSSGLWKLSHWDLDIILKKVREK